MRASLRRLACALAVFGLLAAPTAGLASTSQSSGNLSRDANEPAPPMVDVLVMRPLGLVALVTGVVLWVPAELITLVTQPSQADVPVKMLVKKPYDFIFTDPIGSH